MNYLAKAVLVLLKVSVALILVGLVVGTMVYREWTDTRGPEGPAVVRVTRACSLFNPIPGMPTTTLLETGTSVRRLAAGPAETEVVVLDGPHEGEYGSVANDALRIGP